LPRRKSTSIEFKTRNHVGEFAGGTGDGSDIRPVAGADDSGPNHRDAGLESDGRCFTHEIQLALELVPTIEALNQLAKLERYERRTIWRRRRALRALARLSQMDQYC
jgi:hypothetical protein